MKIGLLKELKTWEKRVLLIPEHVGQLVTAGHEVFVESSAGKLSRYLDEDYEQKGATILPTSEKVFDHSELLLKVQPPLPIEYELIRKHHLSVSFLLLPNHAERMSALLECEATFFAMEMFSNSDGERPVLTAMSHIAGKIAVTEAAKYLEAGSGGKEYCSAEPTEMMRPPLQLSVRELPEVPRHNML